MTDEQFKKYKRRYKKEIKTFYKFMKKYAQSHSFIILLVIFAVFFVLLIKYNNMGDWVAIVGIVVTIILSRLDSVSESKKTRISNELTKKSIDEAKVYNNSLIKINRRMILQRRSEEAMLAISIFNGKIWKTYMYLINASLTSTAYKKLFKLHGLFCSWNVYLTSNVAQSRLIRNGLGSRLLQVKKMDQIAKRVKHKKNEE